MATEQEKTAATAAETKKKTIDGLLGLMTKEFGEGAVMLLGSNTVIAGEAWPTGSISLDMMIGPGGIPRGKLIEIFGPEGGGKTTLCLSIISEVQKRGGICAYIDAEHAVDMDYAKKIGVEVDDLLFNQPEYGEQGISIAARLIESGAVACIVVDSVAALVPKAELDGEMEDANMALQARMMGKAMRKLKILAAVHRCNVLFINQLREKPGMTFGGNPEYTTGGRALKFFADIRLEIRPGEPIKQGEVRIGNNIKAKAVKNKVAPPFRSTTFRLIFGEGIDGIWEILDHAVKNNVVEKNGSWYSYQGTRIGQGEPAALAWMRTNVAVRDQIEAAIRTPRIIDEKPNPPAPSGPPAAAPPPDKK